MESKEQITDNKQENSIIHRLARWIPEHVPTRIVVAAYHILNGICFVNKKTRIGHHEDNLRYLQTEETPLGKGYIENQYAWKNVKFGKTTMAVAGCEIMAVYNVMKALGLGEGPEFICSLIESFEHSGAALNGTIGSSPLEIKRYLCRNGIKCRLLFDENKLSKDCTMAVATVYNDRSDLYRQIHTVAFIKDKDKGIVAHNARTKQPGYPTMAEAIGAVGTNPKTICIIALEY